MLFYDFFYEANAAEFLSQSNAQGARGFRYRGDIAFGTTTFVASSLYVNNSTLSDRFFYELLTPANSTAAFLTQANAQGARKYLFEGTVGLGTPSPVFSAVYVSVRDSVFSSGFE